MFKYPYVWLWCGFAALGACLYGYDGVYFNGASSLETFIHHFGSREADGSYKLRPGQLSVMTSMINVGELVGSLSAAPLNDLLGRKGVFLTGTAAIILGVILQLATTSSRGMLTAGRAVLDFGVGNFSATSPLYMAEVAPTSMRGPLLMCWQLTLSASQIIAAGINRGMLPAAVPRAGAAGHLLGARVAALRALHREEGAAFDPEPHLHGVRAALAAEREAEASGAEGGGGWRELLTDPIERRKVVYSAGALVAQQINGIQWFYYFGTVFSEAIGLTDPFLMTLIVFIIQVFVVFVAVLTVNRLPRRLLLIITTAIMTVSIFIVGCLGIPGNNVSKTFGKVIISFVIIEIAAFNFAWGPLGWTIASEMAVGRNRNKIYAVAVAVASFWVSVWVTVFTLPYLYYSANLGPKTGFVYTGLCSITWTYVYFCVGEVTGRTMEEIEGFFRDGIPARKWKDQPRLAPAGAGAGAALADVPAEKRQSEEENAVHAA